jgi:hypothetical protein
MLRLAFGVAGENLVDPTRPPDNFLEGPAAPSIPAWNQFRIGAAGAVPRERAGGIKMYGD